MKVWTGDHPNFESESKNTVFPETKGLFYDTSGWIGLSPVRNIVKPTPWQIPTSPAERN